MTEWRKATLDEMGVVSRGKSKHRPRNDARLFGGKYPFIQTGDIGAAGLYVIDYSQTYNDVGLAQSKLWEKDTLCITIAANIADTALLAFPACFPDSIMGFLPYENVSNVKFVKYCFDILKKECQLISQGTAQDNLSWKKLSTILFPCPPIEIQNKIAEVLSRYDALIENYQRQIKLLEEAAQRLYKEWFVDLRFPGYQSTPIINGIPKGWERKTIDMFCNVFTGKKNANQAVLNGKYKFFTCGETALLIDSYIYSGPAIIISGNGSYTGRTVFYEGKFDLYQRTYACTIKEESKTSLLYGLYEIVKCGLSSRISGGTHGAAIPYIVMSDITKFDFLFNEIIMQEFSSIIQRILVASQKYTEQIRNLSEARDRLLPKLMSAEIVV